MGKGEKRTELEQAIERVNEIKFEMDLWRQVELELTEDGTKKVLNAEYTDDPLFPVLRVHGFNELTKKEQKHTLYCYITISDWSKSDWIEEYEKTGKSPAYSFPDGVREAVYCHIHEMKGTLKNAKARVEAEKAYIEQLRENAEYYVIGEALLGKRVPEILEDYIFIRGEWEPDTEGLLDNNLPAQGYVKSLPKEEAMKLVAYQTVDFLLDKWSKEYEDDMERWKIAPQWFAKWVDLSFTLNGVEFTIRPEDFRFQSSCPHAFIENISEDLFKDLKKYGAYAIGMGGFID